MNNSASAPVITFSSTVGLLQSKHFTTFKEAIGDMVARIQAEKFITWQFLETACWIEIHGLELPPPLMFPRARDFACEQGLIVESKFQPDAPEPELTIIGAEFCLVM